MDAGKATAAAAAAASALGAVLGGDLMGARRELATAGVTLPGFSDPALGLPPLDVAVLPVAGGAGAAAAPATADAPPPPPRPPRAKPTPALRVDGLLPPAVLADAETLTAALTDLAAECAKYGDVTRIDTGTSSNTGDGGAPIYVVFPAAPLAAVARLAVHGKQFGGLTASAAFVRWTRCAARGRGGSGRGGGGGRVT